MIADAAQPRTVGMLRVLAGRYDAIRNEKTDARLPNVSRSAEALVRSFNSWAFKREQPGNPEALRRIAELAVEREEPLAFVLYWGRGPRAEVAGPERQCLDFLASLARRVESQHPPGADVTLICTDTHARLNGYPAWSTERYFEEVGQEAAGRGFWTCRLSHLVEWTRGDVDSARAEDPPAPEFLGLLSASAAKWYRGGGSVEEGARRYYAANMIERQAVEAVFPNAVFVSFNGSELRPLFPDRMPIFYMYSVRRGVAVKPWFMAAEPEPAAADGVQEAGALP